MSGSVLERFLAQATEDDYLDAQTKPADSGGSGGWSGLVLALTVGFLGLLLVVAVFSVRASSDARTSTRDALVERVTQLSDTVAGQQGVVRDRAAAVEALRGELLTSTAAAAVQSLVEEYATLAATTEVVGPGLTVVIDDAPDAEAGSLNRVLDRDLQDIVNSLWQMGAVGVAVNNQRLTQTSAIRGAGEAILVNYQPLARPYVITAVGTSSAGTGGSALQGLLEVLGSDYGLVFSVDVGDVALPAGELRVPRYAQSLQEDA